MSSNRGVLASATDLTTGKIHCFGGWDGIYLDEIVEHDPDTRRSVNGRLNEHISDYQRRDGHIFAENVFCLIVLGEKAIIPRGGKTVVGPRPTATHRALGSTSCLVRTVGDPPWSSWL
jgi:hypothetical protein